MKCRFCGNEMKELSRPAGPDCWCHQERWCPECGIRYHGQGFGWLTACATATRKQMDFESKWATGWVEIESDCEMPAYGEVVDIWIPEINYEPIHGKGSGLAQLVHGDKWHLVVRDVYIELSVASHWRYRRGPAKCDE